VSPHLIRGYAFLGISHKRNRRKPFSQRQMRVMEQRVCGRAKLQTALSALKQFAWLA
jgi:hypothetical protein